MRLPNFTDIEPLNERERRALSLWAGIITALLAFDATQRGASTLTEANRAIYRRVGGTRWTVGWSSFAFWFVLHVKKGA